MGKVLVLYMVFPLWMILIFQPYLNDLESGRDAIAQVAIERATERAALDGYFTQENIEGMQKLLAKAGYSEEDITLEITTEAVDRGNYVSGTLKVPDQYTFILIKNMLERGKEQDQEFHINTATRMSEAIN